MNKTQLTYQEQIDAAYQWLKNNPSKSLQQAAMRFHISDKVLTRELRRQYNYSASKALEERNRRQFEKLCRLWPQIKHELDNTEDRALEIIRRYGYGQNSLNALTVHYKYDIETRANKIRQAKRERTLNSRKPKQSLIELDELRYMALCMPWRNAA